MGLEGDHKGSGILVEARRRDGERKRREEGRMNKKGEREERGREREGRRPREWEKRASTNPILLPP